MRALLLRTAVFLIAVSPAALVAWLTIGLNDWIDRRAPLIWPVVGIGLVAAFAAALLAAATRGPQAGSPGRRVIGGVKRLWAGEVASMKRDAEEIRLESRSWAKALADSGWRTIAAAVALILIFGAVAAGAYVAVTAEPIRQGVALVSGLAAAAVTYRWAARRQR